MAPSDAFPATFPRHIEPEDGDPPPRAAIICRHPGLQLRKLLAESFPATVSLVAGELDGVDARCRLVDDHFAVRFCTEVRDPVGRTGLPHSASGDQQPTCLVTHICQGGLSALPCASAACHENQDRETPYQRGCAPSGPAKLRRLDPGLDAAPPAEAVGHVPARVSHTLIVVETGSPEQYRTVGAGGH